ncbi:MAG: hotdog domain-containing protein [Anaerovoracaceae bacterium]
MVRFEDLNHHKNLYAGRGIEWMIESAFISAALAYGDGEGILYKNTHQFEFNKSIAPGEIITFESSVVRAGTKSLTMYVSLTNEYTGERCAEGYATFVTVDPKNNRPVEHGISLGKTDDEEEHKRREVAASFFK